MVLPTFFPNCPPYIIDWDTILLVICMKSKHNKLQSLQILSPVHEKKVLNCWFCRLVFAVLSFFFFFWMSSGRFDWSHTMLEFKPSLMSLFCEQQTIISKRKECHFLDNEKCQIGEPRIRERYFNTRVIEESANPKHDHPKTKSNQNCSKWHSVGENKDEQSHCFSWLCFFCAIFVQFHWILIWILMEKECKMSKLCFFQSEKNKLEKLANYSQDPCSERQFSSSIVWIRIVNNTIDDLSFNTVLGSPYKWTNAEHLLVPLQHFLWPFQSDKHQKKQTSNTCMVKRIVEILWRFFWEIWISKDVKTKL